MADVPNHPAQPNPPNQPAPNPNPPPPTPAQPGQPPQPVSPQQQQAANTAQTAQASQATADAAKRQAAQRQSAIQAAARAQRSIVQARNEEIRPGDHVVVDLERVPRDMHTVALREKLQFLFRQGAHQLAGRVQAIEDTPNGREIVVETSNAVYRVPTAAAVRADLYVEQAEPKVVEST